MFDLSINVWIWKWFLQNLNYFPPLILARSGIISELNSPTSRPAQRNVKPYSGAGWDRYECSTLRVQLKAKICIITLWFWRIKKIGTGGWGNCLFGHLSGESWLIVAHLPRNVDFRLRLPKFHHDAGNEKIWHHKSCSRCKYELFWKSSKQFR